MRCEDCLPLVEEYFDGEVEETVAARMGAHLAACETCAAALDALSFEQEIYARYDRGLEVTPDLWARVSAEIAREPLPERRAERRSFLSRVREQVVAALGALAARPALASSLALLVVGVAAGSLWLGQRRQTGTSAEVVRNAPGVAVVNTPAVVKDEGGEAPADDSLNAGPADENFAPVEPPPDGPRETAAAQRTVAIAPGIVASEDDIERLLASPSAPPASPNIVVIAPDEHDDAADLASLFVNASAPAEAVAPAQLDTGEKDVARHVEQTQMLLRTIKNARTADGGTLDIAYEKSLSRRLLAENATLQLEAEVKGDKDTKQVLDTIEPFLLDIANLRDQPSRDEVRSIRERVRKNEIVAALQVY